MLWMGTWRSAGATAVFLGNPESKVYLDTPHAMVPGYHQLA